MSRKPRKDSSRYRNVPQSNNIEEDSIFSSGGEWRSWGESSSTRPCSQESFSGLADGGRTRPKIADLSKEDKQRIARLVTEISRLREEQKDKSSQIKSLSEENDGLKNRISKLEKDINCLQLTVKYSDENYKVLSKSFSEKETSLREQNSELQNKVFTLANERTELQAQLKEDHDQIEKLSKAIYNVSMENKLMNKKYEHNKEKLKIAMETISRLQSEFEESNRKSIANKKIQTEASSSGHAVRQNDRRKNETRNRDERRRDSSDEDSLISELFFIPKQKNLCKSHYTSDDEFY